MISDFINALENDETPASSELAAARKAVEGLSIKLADDPSIAGTDVIINALRVLQDESKPEYILAMGIINATKGISTVDVKGWIKESRRNLSLVGKDGNRPTYLDDIFQNSPLPELIIPAGIRISNDITMKIEPGPMGIGTRELTLAHGGVILTGKTEDIDDGTQGLKISWTEGRGWRHHVIDSSVLMDTKQLGVLKGFGIPLEIMTLREMCSYLLELEAINKETLPVTKTARSFGWQRGGAEGFLAGRDFIRPDGEVISASVGMHNKEWENDSVVFRGGSPGEHQIAEGFHAHGNYGDWVNAIATASRYPVVLSTFYASFVPVMLKIFRCPNFIFSLDCDSSHGKSIAQMIAASVWGMCEENKGESVFQTWDITDFALECRLAVLNSLPLILDDTQRASKTKNGGNFVSDVIYKVCSGRGSGKGQPHGLRLVKSHETVMITSGELRIFEMSKEQHGGTKMRVLGITEPPFGKVSSATEKVVNSLKDTVLQNYGHAGVRFVQFVMRNKDRWEAWHGDFKAEGERYRTMATTDKAGRLATYAGAIAATAKLVHEALELPFKFYQPLDSLWVEISKQAEDAQGAYAAWSFFRSYIKSRENQFHGREMDARIPPSQGWMGRWDRNSNKVAVFPHIVKTTLQAQGYRDPDKILMHWKERGWLDAATDRESRLTRPVCVPRGEKSSTQMVVLIMPDEEEAEE